MRLPAAVITRHMSHKAAPLPAIPPPNGRADRVSCTSLLPVPVLVPVQASLALKQRERRPPSSLPRLPSLPPPPPFPPHPCIIRHHYDRPHRRFLCVKQSSLCESTSTTSVTVSSTSSINQLRHRLLCSRSRNRCLQPITKLTSRVDETHCRAWVLCTWPLCSCKLTTKTSVHDFRFVFYTNLLWDANVRERRVPRE